MVVCVCIYNTILKCSYILGVLFLETFWQYVLNGGCTDWNVQKNECMPSYSSTVDLSNLSSFLFFILHAGSEMCHIVFLILLIWVGSMLFALFELSYHTLSYEVMPLISCLVPVHAQIWSDQIWLTFNMKYSLLCSE